MPCCPATEFASGLNRPSRLAFDTSGNLYVANTLSNTIYKITPDGNVSTFASGLNGPMGLAFDNSCNLYVANNSDDTISKITPEGSVSPFVSSTLNGPMDLAFEKGEVLNKVNFSEVKFCENLNDEHCEKHCGVFTAKNIAFYQNKNGVKTSRCFSRPFLVP